MLLEWALQTLNDSTQECWHMLIKPKRHWCLKNTTQNKHTENKKQKRKLYYLQWTTKCLKKSEWEFSFWEGKLQEGSLTSREAEQVEGSTWIPPPMAGGSELGTEIGTGEVMCVLESSWQVLLVRICFVKVRNNDNNSLSSSLLWSPQQYCSFDGDLYMYVCVCVCVSSIYTHIIYIIEYNIICMHVCVFSGWQHSRLGNIRI